MHLARADLEIDPSQDLLARHRRMQILYFKHICVTFSFRYHSRFSTSALGLSPNRYPTEPSKLIDSSFWASTANSMGSFASTSRA